MQCITKIIIIDCYPRYAGNRIGFSHFSKIRHVKSSVHYLQATMTLEKLWLKKLQKLVLM